CAAPEIMTDGEVFDAEFYAEMYPDVFAVLVTDSDALYQHYVMFGKTEGRLPYNVEIPLPAEMTIHTSETTAQEAATQAEQPLHADQVINPLTGEPYKPGDPVPGGGTFFGEITTDENGNRVSPNGSVFHW
ncbi:MAG: hypothetical protein K2G55_08010, partial [Lachnospiraceae bacterium]|nr:hypothetical protein [Lachnospiraceae bacterium]